MSDNTKIGALLVGLGVVFLTLGFLLFLDSGLLGIGNILLLAGLVFLIGFQRALVFFNPFRRKEKWRAIVLFFSGIALVFMKRTWLGMTLELVGMVSMFGGAFGGLGYTAGLPAALPILTRPPPPTPAFLPIVVSFLRSTPVIGPIFSLPVIGTAVNYLAGVANRRPPV